LLTGLYLFALPYASKWRSARATSTHGSVAEQIDLPCS
jgi:hypothetical protein